MNDDLQCWYKALDLEPGASLEEVNQAYKDLVLVWHPDRLPQDSLRLQEKAQAKLKEINNARDRLREYQATQVNRSHVNGNGQTTNTSSTSTTARSTRVPERAPTYRTSQRQQPRRTSARDRDDLPRDRYQPAQRQQTIKVPETTSEEPQAARSTDRHNHIKTPPRTPPERPDLSGSDWSGKNLSERDFSGRNLTNANLSDTELQDSFLHGTNLHGANLERANLFRANLFQANLSNANLRGANLIGADLSGADLSGADLTGARIRVGAKMMVRLIGATLTGAIMPDGKVYR
ncbi:pentapeptide repeat-containing protein [Chamaesiphon sp. VAR_48_metabat_403]|uniref:pentapeptide repeat-containing protein n=1 Tax=Chamaesiphon sp. VAR_48_metabat_403 TaxID=2964700 RepID=UPI00286DAD87|nr:pentapeptide repeat-containing protein [Chamaesiphon sp. VAR_48_metabat_403]